MKLSGSVEEPLVRLLQFGQRLRASLDETGVCVRFPPLEILLPLKELLSARVELLTLGGQRTSLPLEPTALGVNLLLALEEAPLAVVQTRSATRVGVDERLKPCAERDAVSIALGDAVRAVRLVGAGEDARCDRFAFELLDRHFIGRTRRCRGLRWTLGLHPLLTVTPTLPPHN